jgi:hypothetical protein
MITAVARETDYSLQKHGNVLTEIVLRALGGGFDSQEAVSDDCERRAARLVEISTNDENSRDGREEAVMSR